MSGRRWFITKYKNDAIIVFTALIIRCLFVILQQQADPLFLIPIIDEQTYVNEATGWAKSGFSREALNLPFWQPPGYMMILSLWLYLGGTVSGFVFFQLFLGVVSSWLIYRVMLKIFGQATRNAAVIAAIAYSLCPAVLYYETKLLKPTASIFLMLLIILLAYRNTNSLRAAVAGVLSGILLLVEAYFIIVPLSILISRKAKPTCVLIIISAATFVTFPVALMNARASGSLLPGSYNGPINLHIGNNANWTDTYNTKPGWEWDQLNLRPGDMDPVGGINASDRSALFYDDVADYIAEHPGAFAKGLLTKAVMMFSAMELPRDGAIIFHSKIKLIGIAANTLIVILALLVVTRIRIPALILPLLMLIAISVGFFPSTRYRLAMIPLLLIAAGSIVAPIKPLRLKLIIPTALALVCSGTWVAGKVVDHDKWLAFSYNDAAWYHIKNDDMEKARAFLWQAMRAAETPGVLNTAGMIAFGEDGDYETAVRHFNQAIEQAPNYPDSYLNRARVEVESGNRDGAYKFYKLYLSMVSTDRPGTTDYKYQSTLSALSFTAQLDLENGKLEQALEQFLLMKTIHSRSHGTTADLEILNTQIATITEQLKHQQHQSR